MQRIKLADQTSKNQEAINVTNKRQLPQAFLRKIKEMAEKRAAISERLRKNLEVIESNNNDSGSDTPGGQAIKMLNDDVLTAKLAAAIEYYATIEDPSDDEQSILTELTSVATLLAAGDVIVDPLQNVKEVIQRAEALKMAATGKDFDIDQSVFKKQIDGFASNAQGSNLTFRDAAEAAKKYMKKSSPELK